MHMVGLFINGFDDLKTSIRYFTPFENSQILLGQFRGVEPFSGHVNNLVLFFYPATDEEIRNMK